MSAGPVRAAVAVVVVGALVVWLVQPIGNACPDRGALPAGSARSSSPSFAPPLTRVCTYSTPDGLEARARYVPVMDWLVILAVAGIVAAAARLLGSGSGGGAGREPRPPRAPRERSPRPPRSGRPPPAPAAEPPPAADHGPAGSAPRDAAERERARQERAERARRRRE